MRTHTFVVAVSVPDKITREETKEALKEAIGDEFVVAILQDSLGVATTTIELEEGQ